MTLPKRIACALALLVLGWAVGYAQRSQPEFVISIDAPVGQTRIECVSGCQLMGSRDVPNPRAQRMQRYSYSCGGRDIQRCYASAVGWLVR